MNPAVPTSDAGAAVGGGPSPEVLPGAKGGSGPIGPDALLAASEAVSSTLDATECLRRLAREAGGLLDADTVLAWLVDTEGTHLRPAAGYRVPPALIESHRGARIPILGNPLIAAACTSGRLALLGGGRGDLLLDESSQRRLRFPSGVFIPLAVRGRTLGGLLALWWTRDRILGLDEARLAEGIGRLGALAVDNALLFEASERRRREAQSLAAMARFMTRSLARADVEEAIVANAAALLDVPNAALYRVDPETGVLALATGVGPAQEWARLAPGGAGLVGRARAERRLVVTGDAAVDAPATEGAGDGQNGLAHRIVAAIPLIAGDDVIAVLAMGDQSAGRFDHDSTRLLEAVADQMALALRNADLFARQQSARAEAETRARLREAAAVFGRQALESSNPVALFEEASRLVADALGLEPVGVFQAVPPDPALRLRGGVGWLPEPPGAPRCATASPPGDHPDPADILTELTTGDAGTPPVPLPSHEALRSGLAVPIGARQQPAGVLAACSRRPRVFSGDDASFLDTVAAILVAAMARHRAEASLRASESRFGRLADTRMLGIAFCQPDGTVIDANDLFLELVGYDRDDLAAGRVDWRRLVPGSDRAEEPGGSHMDDTGTRPPFETELLRRDGRRLPVLVGEARLDDSEGPSVAFVLDTTERHRAEAERRGLVHALRARVKELTTLHRLAQALRASGRDLGGILREVVEILPGAWQHPRRMAARIAIGDIEAATSGFVRTPWRQAAVFGAADARTGTVEVCYLEPPPADRAPFYPEEQDVLDSVAEMLRAHVDREIAEAALRDSEAQLRQSQKMEAVGRLAGGIAHDFNNLLTVILGRAQLLAARLPDNDRVRRDAEVIGNAAERAAALTQQLLAFSRKQVVQPRVLDLNSLVEGVARMLQRVIGEDVELSTVLAGDAGRVRADPGQIEQVLFNLATNARDAMPRGGRLTIQTAAVDLDEAEAARRGGLGPGPYVMLAVIDTGVGMDAETLGHIFEPFFTTKEPDRGTGLGLSMVYGIATQSQGSVTVRSEPGRGSAFEILLPRVASAIEAAAIAGEGVAPRGTETILLVEDDHGVRRLAGEVLRDLGYTVLAAQRPEEALELIATRADEIDLLLTDVVMPVMSGRELADQVRGPHPRIRVLYMSGYTDDAIVRHGVLDRSTAFLPKPFTPGALAREVRESLDAPG